MFQYEVHETFIQVGDLYAACRCQQLELFLCREDRIAKGNPPVRVRARSYLPASSYHRIPAFPVLSPSLRRKGLSHTGKRLFLYPYVTNLQNDTSSNSRSMICCCSLSRLIFSFITFSAMAIERSAISERTSRIAFSFSSRIRRAASPPANEFRRQLSGELRR